MMPPSSSSRQFDVDPIRRKVEPKPFGSRQKLDDDAMLVAKNDDGATTRHGQSG
jgi:hypothetical protein